MDGWDSPGETAKRRNDTTKRSRVAGFQARLVFATAMKERASEETRRKERHLVEEQNADTATVAG